MMPTFDWKTDLEIIYTLWVKKQASETTLILAISSRNVDWLSKFFH